jgi:hypothetical protein
MTVYEVVTPQALVERLRSSFPSAVTIAIDGIHGAGKTTLALALRQALGGTLLSLDDFIHKNQGSFLPHLKVGELGEALTAARRPVVLEGICMLDALERLGVVPDLLIYVKRIDRYGEWEEKDTGDPTESAETIIRREAARARPFLDAIGEPPPADRNSGLDSLREEVIRYHCDFHPARRAEIVYLCRTKL